MPVDSRPDPATYMHQVAATDAGRAYKQCMVEAMDLGPGRTVLELGCGPGADLAALADGVGSDGHVLAIDVDPAMAAEAHRRMNGRPGVGVVLADAHQLPLDDASIDRAHADRVLQHVRDPRQVLGELRRVFRPGGRVAVVEPDWATLAIAAQDLDASAGFTEHTVSRVVRNPHIGRQLARLGAAAGFRIASVIPFACLFDAFDEADAILGLTRNTAAAVIAGHLPGPATTAWLRDLAAAPFTAVVTLVGVILDAP